MNTTINTNDSKVKLTIKHLDAELLAGDTVIGRIMIRLANLNFLLGCIPCWIKEFVRFEQTDDGYMCRPSHRRSIPSADNKGNLKPICLYEICLITNTPASVFLYGNKESVSTLPTDLVFDPEKDKILLINYETLLSEGLRKRVHEFRTLRNIPVDEMGREIGTTGLTLGEFENYPGSLRRFITMGNLNKLCDMLDVDIDTLLLGPDPERPLIERLQGKTVKTEQIKPLPPEPKPERPSLTVGQIIKCKESIISNIDNVNVETLLKIYAIMKREIVEKT